MEQSCCAVKPEPAPVETGKIRQYRPLIVITVLSFAAAASLSLGRGLPAMDMLMGTFLSLLALLKLFDIGGFADAFARYDLLAGRVRLYGLAYPLVELALGLLYLSGCVPVFTNAATLVVFGIGTAGVLKTVLAGTKVQCGCIGTGFTLPVGRVTLLENAAMIAMAALNLLAY